MKKSRFCVAILLGSVVLFLLSQELDAISTEDTKRIQHATAAVQSLGKAMKALKFIKWISSVGSVLGPAMLAVTAILDIVFSFLGLESPELRYMKKEFKNLNDRLDSFSERFAEVKKKIDWSSVQMSYGDVEANIRALGVHRRRITAAKTAAQVEEAGRIFKNKYELNYNGDSEKLYNAMRLGSSLSDNIFEASAAYTDQNPELTGEFIKGSLQLLMESFQIQGTYLHLVHNNSELDKHEASASTEKMNEVMSRAKNFYTKLQNNYQQQSVSDIKRMARLNLKLNSRQFVDKVYNYISSKFIQRRWFIAAYNPVKTYEEHYIHRQSVSIYEFAGRNMVLTSVPMQPRPSWSIANAKSTLDFKDFFQYYNPAQGIWQRIDERNKKVGNPVQDCAIVIINEAFEYKCSEGHCHRAKKRVWWCNDVACWIWGVRYYNVVVFG